MRVVCLPLSREWIFGSNASLIDVTTKVASDLGVQEHSIYFLHPHTAMPLTRVADGMRVCVRIETCEIHSVPGSTGSSPLSPSVASSYD